MDEKTLRALLERAAAASVPPSTVDVARARKAGRRRLRMRRAGLPAASFGVVIAVGALFAGGVLPTGATSRSPATTRPAAHAHKSEHASGPMAPASFDPLSIYATFGWLPHGFSVTNPPTPQNAIQSLADVNGPNGQSIALTVYAAHQCSLTGPFWSPPKGSYQFTDGGKHKRYLHSKRYPRGLLCQHRGTMSLPGPVLPEGHLAGGHPAYLMLDQSGHPTALAWQYARDGWAVAQWSGHRPAQIREVAARVRYRSNLRLAFPFRLAGIPATWTVAGAGSQVEGGKLRGYVLYLGPSQDPAGMTVMVQPSYANACSNIGGPTKSVSFDGAAGVLRTSSESVSSTLGGRVRTEHLQDACFASLHGMFVYVQVTRPDGVGGAMGLLRHVHVLGPDPANWTTQPLG